MVRDSQRLQHSGYSKLRVALCNNLSSGHPLSKKSNLVKSNRKSFESFGGFTSENKNV